MTEQKQTTYDRLVDAMFSSESPHAFARDIAAEIDALTAQRDALTAERDFERSASSALADQYSLLAAERNALAAQLAERAKIAAAALAERDEARAQHKFCGLFLNSANAELQRCESALRLALAGTEQKYFAIPARIDDVRAALADAQAQLAAARADVHDAGQRNDDMAASLPTWIHAAVLLPASGTKVLAWDGKNILRAMFAKRFTEEVLPGGEEESTEYSEGLDGYFLVEGWYEHNEFDEVHWAIENSVTHWMPLPTPPGARS